MLHFFSVEGSEAMKVKRNVKAAEAMRGCQACEDLKNNLAKFAMTYWNTVQVNRTVASAHPDKAAAEEMVLHIEEGYGRSPEDAHPSSASPSRLKRAREWILIPPT